MSFIFKLLICTLYYIKQNDCKHVLIHHSNYLMNFLFLPLYQLFSVTFDAINEAADFIKEKIEIRPLIGIICGTGLGSVADRIQNKVVINYNLIPNFPRSTVEGHAGELHIGMLNGVATIAMKGRFHYYEGYTANNVRYL